MNLTLLLIAIAFGVLLVGTVVVLATGCVKKRVNLTVVTSKANLEWHRPGDCGGPDVED